MRYVCPIGAHKRTLRVLVCEARVLGQLFGGLQTAVTTLLSEGTKYTLGRASALWRTKRAQQEIFSHAL